MKEIKIGDRTISEKDKPFFIAEIGINHNGDINIAKKLIDMAVANFADAVKFQKKTLELCVPKEQKNKLKETPWGDMTYLEYKKRLELSKDEFKEIDRYCKDRGIIWFASVWDLPSIEFMEWFDPLAYKVPSAMLTYKELLLKLKELGRPVFLSTGMSTEEEIDKVVKLFGDDYPLIIMHCNSAYPANNDELNLAYITTLKVKYPQHIIGYSGHEAGITPPVVAVALGAKVVERHITLNRAMWGTDQAASVDPGRLYTLIFNIHNINTYLGNGVKRITEAEQEVKKKLRYKETL